VLRRRRVTRENVEDLFSIVETTIGLQLVAEHDLRLGIMDLRSEYEFAGVPAFRHPVGESPNPCVGCQREELARWPDAPAGESARDFDDVLLRVPALAADGVELP